MGVDQKTLPVAVIGAGLDLGAGRAASTWARRRSATRACRTGSRRSAAIASTGETSRRALPRRPRSGTRSARYLGAIMHSCGKVAGRVGEACDAGYLPLVLGGDHSVAIGTLGGMAASRTAPGGVLWVDAHGDLNRPETSPTGNVHGMPLAAALGVAGRVVRRPTPGRRRRSSGPRSSGPLARRRRAGADRAS